MNLEAGKEFLSASMTGSLTTPCPLGQNIAGVVAALFVNQRGSQNFCEPRRPRPSATLSAEQALLQAGGGRR